MGGLFSFSIHVNLPLPQCQHLFIIVLIKSEERKRCLLVLLTSKRPQYRGLLQALKNFAKSRCQLCNPILHPGGHINILVQAFDNRQLEDRIENTSLLSLYTCPAQQLSLFSFYIFPHDVSESGPSWPHVIVLSRSVICPFLCSIFSNHLKMKRHCQRPSSQVTITSALHGNIHSLCEFYGDLWGQVQFYMRTSEKF